ncbi:hypothetical protein MRB53_004076 [Persea americana]|uniref:Uncharacterized protein n=1 Tax=Persea americana TaxID=3435 RepID=A0ACC2MZH9_PERAE|nr:hypothetical protein MRB53_004076 [Persea americana]
MCTGSIQRRVHIDSLCSPDLSIGLLGAFSHCIIDDRKGAKISYSCFFASLGHRDRSRVLSDEEVMEVMKRSWRVDGGDEQMVGVDSLSSRSAIYDADSSNRAPFTVLYRNSTTETGLSYKYQKSASKTPISVSASPPPFSEIIELQTTDLLESDLNPLGIQSFSLDSELIACKEIGSSSMRSNSRV